MLAASALVSNMQVQSVDMDVFPVLMDGTVTKFHEVDGRYDTERESDVVELIHRVQGYGSPTRVDSPMRAEAHLDEDYFNMTVGDMMVEDEYPDDDFVVTLWVEGYTIGPHSFAEELLTKLDRRETRYE